MKGSTLTFEEYLTKMREAKILPEQIGNDINAYNLSRYNDEGPYTKESCRFVQTHKNLAEQKRESPYILMLKKYGLEKTREMQRIAGKKGHQSRRDKKIRIGSV